MAAIVHRRLVRLPAPAPRGPGASLSALTRVGWISLVVAVAWFGIGVRPVLDMGDIRSWSWPEVARLMWTSLADAVIIALPAALEWGVPGARRRTPLLLRGAVLLALQVVVHGAVIVAQMWLLQATVIQFDFDSPVVLSFGLLQLGAVVIGIAGVWALSDGLIDAGAGIDRLLLGAAVVVGLVLASWVVPFYLPAADAVGPVLGRPSFWLSLVALVLYTVDTVLWCVVAVRLIVGFQVRQRPTRAWAIAALAGATIIATRVVSMLLVLGGLQDGWLTVAAQVLAGAPWILLGLAFLAGLGRGRERRDDRPRRMRLFIRNPTA